MADVEIISLDDFDPETNKRAFDAVSYERCYWRGILSFELIGSSPSIIVYSDRNDTLGDDRAVKPGQLEEVSDTDRAKELIAKAIVSCFDHTETKTALSDGNGGWIITETDT